MSRSDGQGVVLLDEAAEIRAEHRATALKRVHTLKLHRLRMMAHKVEDDPDVHIIKHEDRTLDAIKQLGSTKSMHLDLTRFQAGSGGIESDGGKMAPGSKERAPTTVAAVSRIARKAGVKISASVTASEKAKAAAMIAALMKSAKTKLHKVHASPKAVFHRKMKQAMFDYKLYKGRHGHVAVTDATPQSPLAKMLGYKKTGHRGADLPSALRQSLNPKAAAAAKKADFHAKMAAALLAYQRIQGGGGGGGGTQPVIPSALVQASLSNYGAASSTEPEVLCAHVCLWQTPCMRRNTQSDPACTQADLGCVLVCVCADVSVCVCVWVCTMHTRAVIAHGGIHANVRAMYSCVSSVCVCVCVCVSARDTRCRA